MSNFIDRTITSNFSFLREPLSEKGFGTVLLVINDSKLSGVFTAQSQKMILENFFNNKFLVEFGKTYFCQENKKGQIAKKIKIVGNFENDLISTLTVLNDDLMEEFYMVCTESTQKEDILNVSAWTESNKKIFIAYTKENDISNINQNTDVATLLKNGNNGVGFDRTSLWCGRSAVQQEMELSISPSIIAGDKIVFGAIGKDAVGEYDLSIAPVEFTSGVTATIDILISSLNSIQIFKNGIYQCPFYNIEMINEGNNIKLKVTLIKDIQMIILQYSILSGEIEIVQAHETKVKPVLGNNENRADSVIAANRSIRKSGEETLAYQRVKNYIPEIYTVEELNTLDTKRSNYIVSNREGIVSYQGIMSSGLYFDEVRVTDEINERIKEALNRLLINKGKISFNSQGLVEIENTIFNVISSYVNKGVVLEDSIDIKVKKIEEITEGEKVQRKLEGTEYRYILSGAIHQIEVIGTIER